MKKFLKILPVILMVVMVCAGSVFAEIIDPASIEQNIESSNTIASIAQLAKGVWATVIVIIQILAVAAIIFAGLRYMFSSANEKATIKKSMGILAVGALLVLAASTILQLLAKVAAQTAGLVE